jgi:hypothetical protein
MDTKYKTEGDLNFYSELYNLLDTDEDFENKIDESKLCLITQEILINYYVELKCGHKFNYIPLYNDLVNFKKKFNLMEGINTRLSNHEIRCPYCRKKQCELLPYYEELGLEKINGVNFYDDSKNEFTCNTCEFLFINLNFNNLEPETNDNKQFVKCDGLFATKIDIYDLGNAYEDFNYSDNKLYCYTHKKQIIKKYISQKKEKIKQKAKEEKEKIKQKAKEEKEKIKQKAKEEKEKIKQKAKEEKTIENLVLGSIKINTFDLQENNKEINGCINFLKTGPNKGNKCGCKIYSEKLCKRHYITINK